MTPFGAKLRDLRAERGISQKDMAKSIGVSAAYLSALEHGRRGQPTWDKLQRIIQYFNIIWDEAEELQRLAMISDPRIIIDTGGFHPPQRNLPTFLPHKIGDIDEKTARLLIDKLEAVPEKRKR